MRSCLSEEVMVYNGPDLKEALRQLECQEHLSNRLSKQSQESPTFGLLLGSDNFMVMVKNKK